jgi:hypothetical protein
MTIARTASKAIRCWSFWMVTMFWMVIMCYNLTSFLGMCFSDPKTEHEFDIVFYFKIGFTPKNSRQFCGPPAQVAADMYPYIKEAALPVCLLACDIGLWLMRKCDFNQQKVLFNYV